MTLAIALRRLRRAPFISSLIVLCIGLGVGAATAAFALANAVLFGLTPFPDGTRIVNIAGTHRSDTGELRDRLNVSIQNLLGLIEADAGLIDIAALKRDGLDFEDAAGNEHLRAALVTPSLFTLLSPPVRAGRGLREEDAAPSAAPVVVLSEALWQRRFAGDPAVVGQPIRLGGIERIIAGVVPRGSLLPLDADAWVPLAVHGVPDETRAIGDLVVFGRLAPGVDAAGAMTGLDAAAARLREAFPAANQGFGFRARPLLEFLAETEIGVARALAGAAVLLLVIAFVNVAGIMLVQQRRELGTTALLQALGARGRDVLLRELLPVLLLGVCGVCAGVLIALAITGPLRAVAPDVFNQLPSAMGGLRAGALAAVLGLGGVALAALPLHFRRRRRAPAALLRSQLRGGGAGRETHRALAGLVILQIAFTLVLLVGGGLMLRSLLNLRQVDTGLDPGNLLVVELSTIERPRATAERGLFFDNLIASVSALPGVRVAAGGLDVPIVGSSTFVRFSVEGKPDRGPNDYERAIVHLVTPGWFDAMGTRIVAGRAIDARDRDGAPQVVVVSESLARTHWPGESPIGKRIHIGAYGVDRPWMEVVGVARDLPEFGIDEGAQAAYYLPVAQNGGALRFSPALFVRTAGDPAAMAAAIRRTIAATDPRITVIDMTPAARLMSGSMAAWRFALLAFGVFGGAALLLALAGVYGVASYVVTQRTHEFGVRMALGSSATGVARLVLRGMLRIAGAGVVCGLAGALVLSRFLESLLFGVRAIETPIYLAVCIGVLVTVAVAAASPALRAARVDPARQLRG